MTDVQQVELPRETGDRQQRRLDLAARAAWLYYIAGNTQDQIARKLNVSRQAAQRMVATAVSEGLIKFRLDHPIAACIELADALQGRFELEYVEVVPGDADRDGLVGIASAAARQVETHLAAKAPTILAFSTGRTLRATVAQVAPMERPQHTVVSLVGTMTRDGRASPYDVVMRLADRTGATCYPLPTPVVTDTPEQRELLQDQRPYRVVRELAAQAKVAFLGVGTLDATGAAAGRRLHHRGGVRAAGRGRRGRRGRGLAVRRQRPPGGERASFQDHRDPARAAAQAADDRHRRRPLESAGGRGRAARAAAVGADHR